MTWGDLILYGAGVAILGLTVAMLVYEGRR